MASKSKIYCSTSWLRPYTPRSLYLKIGRTKHAITGQSHQTNKQFVLKLICFNKGQYQSASGES